jgi:hypothetical protein
VKRVDMTESRSEEVTGVSCRRNCAAYSWLLQRTGPSPRLVRSDTNAGAPWWPLSRLDECDGAAC